jgi:hypothetical protein
MRYLVAFLTVALMAGVAFGESVSAANDYSLPSTNGQVLEDVNWRKPVIVTTSLTRTSEESGNTVIAIVFVDNDTEDEIVTDEFDSAYYAKSQTHTPLYNSTGKFSVDSTTSDVRAIIEFVSGDQGHWGSMSATYFQE